LASASRRKLSQNIGPHHLVGKEIVRFHTVYWLAFLIAGGLPVPERVFDMGSGSSVEKRCRSRGNVVDPFVLNEVFGSGR
jgi:methionyl-tRNA synthetase